MNPNPLLPRMATILFEILPYYPNIDDSPHLIRPIRPKPQGGDILWDMLKNITTKDLM